MAEERDINRPGGWLFAVATPDRLQSLEDKLHQGCNRLLSLAAEARTKARQKILEEMARAWREVADETSRLPGSGEATDA
jgi:hypothetical protein